MNFLELCQKAHKKSGLSGASLPSVENQIGMLAKLVDFVQEADLDIQRSDKRWKFLWAEASSQLLQGVTDYLPADLSLLANNLTSDQVISAEIDNGQTLKYLSWTDFKLRCQVHIKQGSTGEPTHYTIMPNGKVRVCPIPEKDLPISVEYYKSPVPMVNNTDTTLIPPEYHSAIVYAALKLFAIEQEDSDLYSMADNKFQMVELELCNNQLPKFRII